MSEDIEAVKSRLLAFANKHKLILEDEGEVGFGRLCVGFLTKAGSYLDLNPNRFTNDDKYCEEVWPRDERLQAPDGVRAYHKHECLCVLVYPDITEGPPPYRMMTEEALRQLAQWIDHLDSQGDLVVVEYETGAEGMQALMTGVLGYALRYTDTVEEGA